MPRTRTAGFTLIELMVVIALIAIASAVTSLALRDPAWTRLEHEAARLVALLEAARNEARASGLAASWEPLLPQDGPDDGSAGFRFVGLPASSGLPGRWMTAGVTARVAGARAVLLGPEPMIGAQRIVLRLEAQSLTLATDGLGPFAVVEGEAAAPVRPAPG